MTAIPPTSSETVDTTPADGNVATTECQLPEPFATEVTSLRRECFGDKQVARGAVWLNASLAGGSDCKARPAIENLIAWLLKQDNGEKRATGMIRKFRKLAERNAAAKNEAKAERDATRAAKKEEQDEATVLRRTAIVDEECLWCRAVVDELRKRYKAGGGIHARNPSEALWEMTSVMSTADALILLSNLREIARRVNAAIERKKAETTRSLVEERKAKAAALRQSNRGQRKPRGNSRQQAKRSTSGNPALKPQQPAAPTSVDDGDAFREMLRKRS